MTVSTFLLVLLSPEQSVCAALLRARLLALAVLQHNAVSGDVRLYTVQLIAYAAYARVVASARADLASVPVTL